MDAVRKAEQERIWTGLKPALESLAQHISAFYRALGSDKACRHLNELWHEQDGGLGLGYVPAEAKDKLESLAAQSGIAVHKSGGPLGKDHYLRLLYDPSLTPSKLAAFARRIAAEAQSSGKGYVEKPLAEEEIFEQQLARVEGLADVQQSPLERHSPEVALLVEGFNAMTAKLSPAQALDSFTDAVRLIDLPDAARAPLLALLQKLRAEQKE